MHKTFRVFCDAAIAHALTLHELYNTPHDGTMSCRLANLILCQRQPRGMKFLSGWGFHWHEKEDSIGAIHEHQLL